MVKNRKERRAAKSQLGSDPGRPVTEVQGLFDEALRYHQAGRFNEAHEIYRQILTVDPHHANTLHMTGVLALQVGKPGVAIDLISKAITVRDDVSFHNNLGNALRESGRLEEAATTFRRALARKPDYPDVLNNLANVLVQQGKLDEALTHFQRALEVMPDSPEAHNNIGTLYSTRNCPNEALAHFRRALVLNPDSVQGHFNLGRALKSETQYAEAIECFRKVVALMPQSADAYMNLAECLRLEGLFDAAIAAYQQLLANEPDFEAAWHGLGTIYFAQGMTDDAITCFRRAHADSDVLLSMVYTPSVSPSELAETAREFGRRFADPLLRRRPSTRDKNPSRKLRIGYVSPDLWNHAVTFFFEPLVKLHDRSSFEVFAYSNVGKDDEDAVTARLKHEFDHWRDIRALNDDAAADLIEADAIDILVDLSGHTGFNRLLVFARKPAPVQVTWLGFPATTGMKAMDYRITDSYAEPPGMTDHLNTEMLWRLPQIFCCFRGPGWDVPVIDHPPFEDNGFITFGCFNNFSKVTDKVLEAWAEILNRVPNSLLLLEIKGLGLQLHANTQMRLKKQGLPIERVMLQPRLKENQFVLYNRIDIALDPFPCNGGTTSFDTMWMGVPFVTLAGDHFVSRMGVTILTNAGLPELIAKNTDEYIKMATELALDRDRLRRLRHGLRDRVGKSPLMDQASFARDMEAAYREMWRKWCASSA